GENSSEADMESDRMQGTVKWFSRVKGYGFIAPEDGGKEIFVHFSGIEGEGYRNLEEGQQVTYTVEETPKGPQAVAVRAAEDKPA
ncbi:MAG: cold-shock DNA-binding domain protein, partial [Anaerolineales bacterium]|nr:cold-shock DNA-binding domain protein [Anaerolineales bacterium]